jgi:glyoxylase-like metal-dependent hydrolase (beta-lactamase superfamily II)
VGAAEPVSVRRITTGVVRSRRASRGALRYLIDDWEDDTLPVNAYLVEHPGGRCLFDAGQTAAAAQPGYFPAWHPFLRLARFELEPSDEVSAQLALIGISPAGIDHVVLSHLHTDHVGGLGTFGSSEVVVAQAEWARAQGVRGSIRGYLPGHWPDGLRVRTIAMGGPSVGPFPESYDLLGDGRLVIVPTPGHTPGHLAMVVYGAGRTWLLAGDLVHNTSELEAAAPAIARWCEAEQVEVLTAHDEIAPSGL